VKAEEDTKDKDLIPMSIASVSTIQKQPHERPLLVLFDSGSQGTWINGKALPPGVIGKKVKSITGSTMAGIFTSNQEVSIGDLVLPEFYRSRRIDGVKARIFYSPCRYDLILGRDTLRKIGFQDDFKNNVMTWDDATVSMKVYSSEHPSSARAFEDVKEPTLAEAMFLDLMEEDLFDADDAEQDGFVTLTEEQEHEAEEAGYHSKTILSSKYEEVDVHDVARKCTHLPLHKQNELATMLEEYQGQLFNGKLGVYKGEKVHLDIDPTVPASRSRYYPVPHSQLPVFKEELDRLEEIGVLEKTGRAEWIAGTFIKPKKDGRVRWLSDFRALNKALRRKVYPLPRIQDILHRRRNYKYMTKLDISMQYYTFELDEASKNLCTIATPFGLYRYCRLPMGVSQSPDIAQQIMEEVLRDIDGVECFIDDVAIFSNNWEDHKKVVKEVLDRLQTAGFTINPRKCEWAVQETDFLGHWLTPTGVKPWQKKVDAILKMEAPTGIKELRSFLGMVTYYRDMWPQRSHVLSPLTDLIGTKKFVWNEECEQAFKKMKALIAADALLAYPDHNKAFDVETDASDYQLGAVIKQDGRPVAYYSRKLNKAQRNYTTIEKELLSIVETLKEFRTMLLGAEIRVYTDHKNLTHKLTSFTTQRVMRWRLLLEEYGCKYFYKEGAQNVVADALSRVPTTRMTRSTEADRKIVSQVASEDTPRTKQARPEERKHKVQHKVQGQGPGTARSLCTNGQSHGQVTINKGKAQDKVHLNDASMYEEQPELADCLLEYPTFDPEGRSPFHFETIRHYQQLSEPLKQQLNSGLYRLRRFGNTDLICQLEQYGDRIILSDEMLPRLVRWYHLATAHIEGINRLEATIGRHFYHPALRQEIQRQISVCHSCQINKRGGYQYGELAPREAIVSPWQEVHVDTIGPWKIKVNGVPFEFRAQTCIDPVTNLLEVNRVSSTTSAEAARSFENNWIARYPRAANCVHDNGPEFIGHDFQFLLANAHIRSRPTTSANPESNGIIESVHKSVGAVIRTQVQAHPPTNQQEATHLVDRALATAMHATRCASHSSLNHYSPGGLVFRRDMFLDIPLIADIIALQNLRQQGIDRRLLKANAKRRQHEFTVGQLVLKRRTLKASDKALSTFLGPYPIVQVHTNGTVTLQLTQHVRERINIRKLVPYRSNP